MRDHIQNEALKLSRENDHLLLTWATGCGKSLAALKILAEAGGMWLIVCKEITHIDNWRREISKFDPEGTSISPRIEDIICYASLPKYKDVKGINLVLDEVHGLSELRELRIADMEPSKIVSLSATVDDEIRGRLESILPFKEYTISTSQAVEMGILPVPKVFVVYSELDDVVKSYTAKFGKNSVKLTARGYYNYISKQIDYWKDQWEEKGESWRENKFKMAALGRKKWLAEYKTESAEKVLKVIKGRRFVCFTGSIEQCDKLGGTAVVHSKISPKRREKLIEELNAGILNSLYCVNMMRESINISSIEAGMIIQLDGSSDRSFIQALGRTLRGENPEFFVLVVKGTKDEDYFRNATYNFNKKYLHVWA